MGATSLRAESETKMPDPVVTIKIPAPDAQALEEAALAAGIDDRRMRRSQVQRGSLAGLLRALAAAERRRPGSLARVLAADDGGIVR